MAKKATVEGEVIVKDGASVGIEFYTQEFLLDDSITDIAQARVIIKKGKLADRLRREVKNYKRFRTCEIVKFEDVKEEAEETEVDKKLVEATRLKCVPENLNNYKTPDAKEKALDKAIDKAKERQKKQKKSQNKENENVEDQGYVD